MLSKHYVNCRMSCWVKIEFSPDLNKKTSQTVRMVLITLSLLTTFGKISILHQLEWMHTSVFLPQQTRTPSPVYNCSFYMLHLAPCVVLSAWLCLVVHCMSSWLPTTAIYSHYTVYIKATDRCPHNFTTEKKLELTTIKALVGQADGLYIINPLTRLE